MDQAPLLRVDRVSQAFPKPGGGELLVLDRIDLALDEGEIVGLLGRSGSGKSTLLRLIAGLAYPIGGKIAYRGRAVEGPASGIAMVFQSFALFPWLTVLENVEIGLEAQGLANEEGRKRALSAIDLIGLDGFENAYPKELSGGMRQRVGIARALVVQPDILILDESFSALDVLTAENLRGDLLALWSEGHLPIKGILMVTHNIEEAVSMCHRVLVFSSNPGRIVREIAIDLPYPRDRYDEAFRARVEEIYVEMTGHGAGAAAAARGRHDLGTLLPRVPANRLLGLLESLDGAPYEGRADLPDLAQELSMEVDDLFPIFEALELLGFAELSGGDIALTELGRRIACQGTDEQKALFREQLLSRFEAAAMIHRELTEAPNNEASWTDFSEALEEVMTEADAKSTLRTLIDWGRYAELYSYDSTRARFSLDDAAA